MATATASPLDLDPAHSQQAYQRRWLILAVLCFCLLVVSIDNTILNVALPTLVEELHASASQLQWIVDAYTLVFASLLLTAGTMGDKFGRRGALMVGLLVFGTGSAISAFVGSASALIVMRGVMGLGGAFIMPSTLSILTNVFPSGERARAIGIWAGVSGLGVALGPLTGGFLLEHFWWGSVFLVNVPVVIVAVTATWFVVPRTKDPTNPKLDMVGTVLSAVGLFAALYAIIEGPSKGWTSTTILVAFAIGIVLLTGFVLWELHSRHPMLDVRFFKNPRFSAASLAVTFVFFAMFGSLFFLSQYLQFVLGYDALETGVALIPVAAVLMIAAPSSSILTRHFGTKVVVAGGLAVVGAGLLVLGQASTDSGYALVATALILLGLGMGTAMAPATDSIMGSLPPERAGVGSAVNDTTREIGGALGVAILGSIAASSYTSAMAGSAALKGLPTQAVDAASNSIGGAVTVASKLAGTPLASAAEPLLAAAKEAFVAAMDHSVTIGAIAAGIGALVALVFLPARPRAEDEAKDELESLVVSTAENLKTAPKSVVDAALSALAEAGFASLSFSGVATRAGVSTATIERLWTSKLDMVTTVVEQLQADVAMPDTGSLRTDCEQFVGDVIQVMATADAQPVIANLVGEAGRDPELAAKLRARLIAPRRAEVVRMLAVGQARGELPPDADLAFLADLLVSPLYYRLLVSGEPLEPRLAHEITDAVLGPAPAGRAVSAVEIARSAVVIGTARFGAGSLLAQGAVVRAASADAVTIGADSAVLENSVVQGVPHMPSVIGRRTVFGHRCLVVGATLGDLCEIGNASILMPGAVLGTRVFLGEGTLVPSGMTLADESVAVGRPARVVRQASADDIARLTALRGGDLSLPSPTFTTVDGIREMTTMGQVYDYRGIVPTVAPSAVLFPSAELTGDVVVGERTVIGAGVKIIGDSHGPVRIGADVQILENTVLHLLPDNDLVLDDGVVIGPGAMIHGCRIGAGSVVEPGAIVCDHSVLGAGCVVRAGAVVKQRSEFGAGTEIDGFPAVEVGRIDGRPSRPPWAFASLDDLPMRIA